MRIVLFKHWNKGKEFAESYRENGQFAIQTERKKFENEQLN